MLDEELAGAQDQGFYEWSDEVAKAVNRGTFVRHGSNAAEPRPTPGDTTPLGVVVWVGTVAPDNHLAEADRDLWCDTSTSNVWKRWDGTAWVTHSHTAAELDAHTHLVYQQVYNAECAADGVTDDLAAINAAISDAAAAGGGVVQLPEGVIRTSGWVDIDADNIILRGKGRRATTIMPLDAANVGGIRVGSGGVEVTDLIIENLGFDGNDLNQTSGLRHHGIKLTNARRATVRNCYLTRTHPYHAHNTGGSGISVEDTCADVTVADNHIFDIGDRGIQFAADGGVIRDNVSRQGFDRSISLNLQGDGGADQESPGDVVISGNVLSGNVDGSGIGLAPSNVGVTIVGNSISSCRHGALKIYLGHEVAIVGNWLGSDNDVDGVITVDNAGSGGALSIRANHIVLESDSVKQVPGVLVRAPIDGLDVSGNHIRGDLTRGVELSATSTDCTVADNHIEQVGGTPATPDGVVVPNGATAITVSANTIRGAWRHGVYVAGQATSVDGNHISNVTDRGVYVATATARDTAVRNNTVIDPGGHAINFAGGDALSTGTISGNVLRRPTKTGWARGIQHVGGSVVIADNYVEDRGIELGASADNSTVTGNRVSGDGIQVRAASTVLTGNVTGGILLNAGADNCVLDHDPRNHGAITDNAAGTIINGVGAEAAGVGGTPPAANWPTGATVHNTDDDTLWLKTQDGTMRQIA